MLFHILVDILSGKPDPIRASLDLLPNQTPEVRLCFGPLECLPSPLSHIFDDFTFVNASMPRYF